jgi:hypothetical protein
MNTNKKAFSRVDRVHLVHAGATVVALVRNLLDKNAGDKITSGTG